MTEINKVLREHMADGFLFNGSVKKDTDLNTLSLDGVYFLPANGEYINYPSFISTSRSVIIRNFSYSANGRFMCQIMTLVEEESNKIIIRYVDTVGMGTTKWTSMNTPQEKSITSSMIADKSITNNKIEDASITRTKLASNYSYNGQLSSGNTDTLIKDGKWLVTGNLSNLPIGVTSSGYLDVSVYGSFIIQNYTVLNNPNETYSRIIRETGTVYVDWVEAGTDVRSSEVAVFMGDSLIEFGTIPSDFQMKTGIKTYNLGIGGTRMARHELNSAGVLYKEMSIFRLAHYIHTGNYTDLIQAAEDLAEQVGDNNLPIINRLAAVDWNKVDYLFISIGTNDYATNNAIPIGEDTDNLADGSTFKGAMNYAIEQIQTAYPNIHIIFTTPIYRTRYQRADDGLNSDNHPNAQGYYLKNYAQAIIDVAKENHLPVIDLHSRSGINQYTSSRYHLPTDGVHPSAAGYSLMAKKITAGFITEFV